MEQSSQWYLIKTKTGKEGNGNANPNANAPGNGHGRPTNLPPQATGHTSSQP